MHATVHQHNTVYEKTNPMYTDLLLVFAALYRSKALTDATNDKTLGLASRRGRRNLGGDR